MIPIKRVSVRRPRWAAVVAVLVAGLAAAGCEIGLRAEARNEWTRSYTLAESGSLEISNTNGRIEVEAVDGNRVEVVAQRIAHAGSDDDAREALSRIDIVEDVSPTRIRLESSRSGVGVNWMVSVRIDYTVRVPRAAAVTLKSTNGQLRITGLSGPLEARTTNGEVHGRDLRGGASVETTNGDVSIDVAAIGGRGIHCETTNGSVDISVPRDAKADVSASVTNGDIEVIGLDLSTTEKTRRRLHGTIGGGGAPIRIETTNGGVQVRGR
jgi:DUF4097 and DUF4098 domain-containing protein YvlB